MGSASGSTLGGAFRRGGRVDRGGLTGLFCPAGPPGGEQPVLEPEHVRALLRLRVVVAEQVQDAVHGEQFQLVLGAVPRTAGLHRRNLRAEHHVTEQAGVGAWLLGAGAADVGPAQVRRPQLVHGEGQHIGRPRLTHPAFVQLGHGFLVHQQHRKLRERVDAQLVQDVAGDRGQRDFIHPHTGLVGDVNAHQVRAPVSDRASPLRVRGRAGLRPGGRRTARRRPRSRPPAGAGPHRGW